MLTSLIRYPDWCDLTECDADPRIGRGWHQARPMDMPYDDRSRSSGSVLLVGFPGEASTWIRIVLHTIDAQGDPADCSYLFTPGQARVLGRHLLRAGQEAMAAEAEGHRKARRDEHR